MQGVRQTLRDCLQLGYVVILPPEVHMNLEQKGVIDLCNLWGSMTKESKDMFIAKYGQIARLSMVQIESSLLEAVVQFWDPSHRCFSFNKNDLVHTIEEYSVLMGLKLQFPDKIYNANRQVQNTRRLAKTLGQNPDTF